MVSSSLLLRRLTSSAFLVSVVGLLPHCGSDPAMVVPASDELEQATGGVGGRGTGGAGVDPKTPNIEIPDGGAMNNPSECPDDDCKPVERPCGNGKLDDGEECDDANSRPGDGCSGRCKVEPNYECAEPGEACVFTVVCGDGAIGGDEACDDANTDDGDGCSSACTTEPGHACGVAGELCNPTETEACGDGVVNAGEQCDDANLDSADGCTDDCRLIPGYTCQVAGQPCELTDYCGDGEVTIALDEQCDDANADGGDGCSSQCRLETNFVCAEPGKPCESTVECGDRAITGPEQCDDGDTGGGDGCSATCQLEPGWLCTLGGLCRAAACGDGLIVGREQCDDSNAESGDGCSESCQLEVGFKCEGAPSTCVETVCGDGAKEGLEPCDDGNDQWWDGCTPTCTLEPDCKAGACTSRCGDGIKLPGDAEECDDANILDGDGCSSSCLLENIPGITCADTVTEPDTIEIPIVFRDFISRPENGSARHPDFEACYAGSQATPGLVETSLDTSSGKPVYSGNCGEGTSCSATTAECPYERQMTNDGSFADWYDTSDPLSPDRANIAVVDFLRLRKRMDGSFVFDSADAIDNPVPGGFFPVDDKGWVALDLETNSNVKVNNVDYPHNFGFTSETRYWFEYKGGELLSFSGDDDVWVFIGGKLAVDLGGLHPARTGSVTLSDSDTNADNKKDDSRFGLVEGRVYEIALFHAERHTNASNFKLTIKGFNSGRTVCAPECGDGIVAGSDEICDDGDNDGSYGTCKNDCTLAPYCGDGLVSGPELCDLGVNVDSYMTSPDACAPGCIRPPDCGDGQLDGRYEQCDTGDDNQSTAYGPDACTDICRAAPYCGDSRTDADHGEICDDGPKNGSGLPGSCYADCSGRIEQPSCGNGQTDSNEQCDEGAQNGTAGSGCDSRCRFRCGNGVKETGEECDDGINDGSYGTCESDCKLAPYCGDGETSDDEECDAGDDNDDKAYGEGECTKSCLHAPYCGDHRVQGRFGESCDGGGSCTPSCDSLIE
jgi:fibro-slime domain-containing protein